MTMKALPFILLFVFGSLFGSAQFLSTPDPPIMHLYFDQDTLHGDLSLDVTSNNWNLQFLVHDPSPAPAPGTSVFDSLYRFEGFLVFQVITDSLRGEEFLDTTQSRLVFQTDSANGIGSIVNWEYDSVLGVTVPVNMVNGSDIGIEFNFSIANDAFTGATIDSSACYAAVSYAYTEGAAKAFLIGNRKSQKCGVDLVSIQENEPFEFSMFPNPTNSIVRIELGSNQQKRINIIDGLGRLVQTRLSAQKSNSFSGLNTGQYMVQIIMGDQTVVKKLIVN